MFVSKFFTYLTYAYLKKGSVKIAPQKIATYENTHLWKFPPLKIAPLKINPKKIAPYESCHHSRQKL